ncbi:MAG TPA: L,D-transpeptidase family protein, partial [Burkholderiales bacterium]|nr:L,D-transpeptidase family protein [Burkholderiales bacterium]
TPLGVYQVTGNMSREMLNNKYGKVAEQYGVGALPISYPNEWDRRSGRNGHGIWLHGVPFDTYSRPPRASNGCVAMTNEDFMTLSKSVQVGVTPVIIANGIEWASPDTARTVRQDLGQAIEGWRRDWESLNTDSYLKHYSSKFSNGTQRYESWAEHKYRVNAGKTWLKVKLDNVSIFFYPGSSELAVVTFDQDYASSNLVGQARKRQYWMKESKGWRIVYEGTA